MEKDLRKELNIDAMLHEALGGAEEPGAALVERAKLQFYREGAASAKKPSRRRFGVAAIIAAALALTGATAFAAWVFMDPGDVAGQFGDQSLRAAFKSDTAVNINVSVASGGYLFTLLAVVSGGDITDFPYYSDTVQPERTYAVLAIQKTDGSPIDMESGYTSGFFATPLVKGLNPAVYNVVTMNGGYAATVADGVMYRVVECDNIEIFADHGLYFAVNTGAFYSQNAFIWDEQTGEVKANPDFDGASAVFDLPIDKSLGDPEKAARWLAENQIGTTRDYAATFHPLKSVHVYANSDGGALREKADGTYTTDGGVWGKYITFGAEDGSWNGSGLMLDSPGNSVGKLASPDSQSGVYAPTAPSDITFTPDATSDEDAPPPIDEGVDWENATPVAATLKTLTKATNGVLDYEFEFEHGGGRITTPFDECFTDEKTAQSKIVSVGASEGPTGRHVYAVRFDKGADGVVTGVVLLAE